MGEPRAAAAAAAGARAGRAAARARRVARARRAPRFSGCRRWPRAGAAISPKRRRHWRRALELDPKNLEAAYALALDTERQGGAANDAEARAHPRASSSRAARTWRRVSSTCARREARRPGGAERGPRAAGRGVAGVVARRAGAAEGAAGGGRRESRGRRPMRVAFLKNVLLREPAYRAALADVSTPRAEVGQPLVRFLRLKNPEPQPAPADEALTFAVEPSPNAAGASWAGAMSLTGDGEPGRRRRRRGGALSPAAGRRRVPRWSATGRPRPTRVAAADLNYDFRTDLALAGPGGLCLLRQDDDGPVRRRDGRDEAAGGASARASLRRLARRHRHGRRPRSRARAARRPRRSSSATTATERSRRAMSFAGVDARARLRLGRPRRRRRPRRGVPRRGGRRPRVPQPARRQLPGRDAAGRPGAGRGDRARRTAAATRCSICSCCRATARITRLVAQRPRRVRGR